MKFYCEFKSLVNGDHDFVPATHFLDKWITHHHLDYKYKIAGYSVSSSGTEHILLAFWPNYEHEYIKDHQKF